MYTCRCKYVSSPPPSDSTRCVPTTSTTRCMHPKDREFFVDNLLVWIHLIIEMILVDWPCAMRLEFPCSSRVISTFLVPTTSSTRCMHSKQIIHPTPKTRNSKPEPPSQPRVDPTRSHALIPKPHSPPQTWNPAPSTRNFKPLAPNLKPCTIHPKPEPHPTILNPLLVRTFHPSQLPLTLHHEPQPKIHPIIV